MDKALKQRLVGASLLIALAVIFLPMFFDDDSEDRIERRELALDVPDSEEGERRIRRLSLDPAEARRPAGDAEAPRERREPGPDSRADESDAEPRSSLTSADDLDRAEDEASEGVDEPESDDTPAEEPSRDDAEAEAAGDDGDEELAQAAAEPEADPDSEAESAPEAAAQTADDQDGEAIAAQPDGGWTVQVAVFGNIDTADSVRDRLQQLGHEVMVDIIERNQTELHRLRTGPYASESEAGRARDQIAATVAGVEPVVRELASPDGGEERRGMSVQVGSFASRNNAERLVGQLEAAGHDAFMHGEDSGGRTIWRVRVGTFETREEAERLLETLTEEEGLQGIVVSHP